MPPAHRQSRNPAIPVNLDAHRNHPITGAEFTVDSDAISAHGTDTATLVTDLETSLTNLNTKLTTLQTQWKGSAQTNFTSLMTTWNTDMNKLKSTLDTISSTLHLTSSEYSTAEDNNVRRWVTA
ncbi:WXG100 family type VII secretion target [Dermacoccus nishinomiyaensis]|uniref:WXG100 family type VII secretion target n=1 Tax=Dermacoccus nishinomiyaensis TaxID=1274 RepID=UPI0030B93848